MLDDCHAVRFICFFFILSIMLIGLQMSVLQPGLVIECIIYFIFSVAIIHVPQLITN